MWRQTTRQCFMCGCHCSSFPFVSTVYCKFKKKKKHFTFLFRILTNFIFSFWTFVLFVIVHWFWKVKLMGLEWELYLFLWPAPTTGHKLECFGCVLSTFRKRKNMSRDLSLTSDRGTVAGVHQVRWCSGGRSSSLSDIFSFHRKSL